MRETLGVEPTALVVLVPEAEHLVSEFRMQFDPSAKEGLGAHITILYPFVPSGLDSQQVILTLPSLCHRHKPFTFSLRAVAGFPAALYLAVSPELPFRDLTRAVATAFPDYPPYDGAFSNPVPHLTIAHQPPAQDLAGLKRTVERELNGRLPLECAVSEVCWIVKHEGRWHVRERFFLGGVRRYELVTPTTVDQWDAYHRIRREVLFEARGQFDVYDANHPDERARNNHPKLLMHAGDAVGVVQIDIDHEVAALRRVAVRADVQHGGHGRMLLTLAEQFAHVHGCSRLVSFVAVDAVGFYQKCGFVIERSEAVGPSGNRSVLMGKVIPLSTRW